MAKLKNRVGANNQRVEHVENEARREISVTCHNTSLTYVVIVLMLGR